VVAFLYVGEYSADGHLVDISVRSPKPLPLDAKPSTQPSITPGTPLVSGQLSDAVSKSEGQTHLQVYIAGDKFQIEDLKSRAIDRLKAWCEENCESLALLEVVEDAVALSLDDDTEIRDILAEVLYKHITEIRKHPDFFGSLFAASGKISGAIIWHLVEDQTISKQKASAAVDHLIKTVNSMGRCDGCYTAFNVKLYRSELVEHGRLRCRNCSKVH
jgi:hypothetical protein